MLAWEYCFPCNSRKPVVILLGTECRKDPTSRVRKVLLVAITHVQENKTLFVSERGIDGQL